MQLGRETADKKKLYVMSSRQRPVVVRKLSLFLLVVSAHPAHRFEFAASVVQNPKSSCSSTHCPRGTLPRCSRIGFVVKESTQWHGCCFSSRFDCLPLAGAPQHGWATATIEVMRGFQFGRAPYLAVPVRAGISNAHDCQRSCLKLSACKYGTFISTGERRNECWLAASTHRHRHVPCIGDCVGFRKILRPATESRAAQAIRKGRQNSNSTAMSTSAKLFNATNLPPRATVPVVQVGSGNSTVCGAMTGASSWQLLGAHGALYTDVDSSMCDFTHRTKGVGGGPASLRVHYVSAIVDGGSYSWLLHASHIESRQRTDSFRVVTFHPMLRGPALLLAARKARWQISWIGDTGRNSGRTMPGATGWKAAEVGGGLRVDVNTGPCGFPYGSSPRYFLSLTGQVLSKFMKAVSGVHTAYYPHFAGFRVYLSFDECIGHLCLGDDRITPAMAEAYGWSVGWIAAPGTCRQASGADCSDDMSRFGTLDDRGFPSSGTSGSDWRDVADATHAPAATSVPFSDAGLQTAHVAPILPSTDADANPPPDAILVDREHRRLSSQPFASANLPIGRDLRRAIYIEVDTSASEFNRQPAYVASIAIDHANNHWHVSGAATIYKPWRNGFRLYLTSTMQHEKDVFPGKAYKFSSGLARMYHWRVNYFGFDGKWQVDCVVSQWSTWGGCTASCDNQGVLSAKAGPSQTRMRSVLQRASLHGRACPLLRQQRPCARLPCPVDCSMSPWSSWFPPTCETPVDAVSGRCPKASSPTAMRTAVNFQYRSSQLRKRRVLALPSHGGRKCNSTLLQQQRPCRALPCAGTGTSSLCGARTKNGAHWRPYGSNGLYIRVNTSSCKFKGTPQYAFALHGLAKYTWFGLIAGTSSVVSPTKSTFDAVLWYPGYSGAVGWPSLAQRYGWSLSWIGDTGNNTGSTPAGATGWRSVSMRPSQSKLVTEMGLGRGFGAGGGLLGQLPTSASMAPRKRLQAWQKRVLAVDIILPPLQKAQWKHAAKLRARADAIIAAADTSPESINSATADALHPVFVTSITGLHKHWRLFGGAMTYMPTRDGFRVYITCRDVLEPAIAEKFLWTISWIAVEPPQQYSAPSDNLASGDSGGSLAMSKKISAAAAAQVIAGLSTAQLIGGVSNSLGYAGGVLHSMTAHGDMSPLRRGEIGAGGSLIWIQRQDAAHGSTIYSDISLMSQHFAPKPAVVPMIVVRDLYAHRFGALSMEMSPQMYPSPRLGFRLYQGATYAMLDRLVQPDWSVSFIGYAAANCTVGPWTPWSICTHTCGGGEQTRHREVRWYGQGKTGRRCPSGAALSNMLEQRRQCGMGMCIGRGPSAFCGGTTASLWRAFGTVGLYMDANTSACEFAVSESTALAKPFYSTAVIGDALSGHWEMLGSHGLVADGIDRLRAVLSHRLLRGPALRHAAQQQKWKLSWIGDTGSNCGSTPRRGTAWKQRTAHGLRLHVNTAQNGLFSSSMAKSAQNGVSTASSLTSSEVVYLPSLLGLRSHWRLRGQSTVRFATERGFDLFILSDKPIVAADPLKGPNSPTFEWTVMYIATRARGSGIVRGPWQRTKSGGALYIDVPLPVPLRSTHAHARPTAVVSVLSSMTEFTGVSGGGNIFALTPSSFRSYLHAFSSTPQFAHQNGWSVAFLLFEGGQKGHKLVLCRTTMWSNWAPLCPTTRATCVAAAQRDNTLVPMQHRYREIDSSPVYSEKCHQPVRKESRPCAQCMRLSTTSALPQTAVTFTTTMPFTAAPKRSSAAPAVSTAVHTSAAPYAQLDIHSLLQHGYILRKISITVIHRDAVKLITRSRRRFLLNLSLALRIPIGHIVVRRMYVPRHFSPCKWNARVGSSHVTLELDMLVSNQFRSRALSALLRSPHFWAHLEHRAHLPPNSLCASDKDDTNGIRSVHSSTVRPSVIQFASQSQYGSKNVAPSRHKQAQVPSLAQDRVFGLSHKRLLRLCACLSVLVVVLGIYADWMRLNRVQQQSQAKVITSDSRDQSYGSDGRLVTNTRDANELQPIPVSDSIARVLALECTSSRSAMQTQHSVVNSDVMDVDDSNIPQLGVSSTVFVTHEHEVAQTLMAEAKAAIVAEDKRAKEAGSCSDRRAYELDI